MTSRPPVLVGGDPAELPRLSGVLAARGWTLRPGFALPDEPWDLTEKRWACHGAIANQEQGANALWALVRGCAVVVSVEPSEFAAGFLADLRRVGELEPTDDAPSGRPLDLDPAEEALLAALADGASVQEAAARLFLSRRTAQRRLSSARAALGVRTTREAVLAWTRQRDDAGRP